jgi:hypothetical protein
MLDFLKVKKSKRTICFDSGIRLNLVTDYFIVPSSLFSNGWEVGQPKYNEKLDSSYFITQNINQFYLIENLMNKIETNHVLLLYFLTI